MSDSPQIAITVRNLKIGYGEKIILQNVNFQVRHGEVFVILGGSGCGKSTLLKNLIGLYTPLEGEVWIDEENFVAAKDNERLRLLRKFGVMYQSGALFGSMTVLENVRLALDEFTALPEPVKELVALAKLKLVGLGAAAQKMPSELSGGMQKRAAIARAMALDPKILFLDEPSAGLDPITSTTIMELVMKQRDVSHTTSLMVTHRLQDAFMLATHRFDPASGGMKPIPKGEDGHNVDPGTRFLMLNEGKIVFNGNTVELIHSDDPWIKEYLE